MYSFAYGYAIVTDCLLKRLFFLPSSGCDILVENQMTIEIQIYPGQFYSIDLHVYLYVNTTLF